MQISCFYQVRFSTDLDEPVLVVPSCCVWTESGLNTIPAKAGTDAATLNLQRIAGESQECCAAHLSSALLVTRDGVPVCY